MENSKEVHQMAFDKMIEKEKLLIDLSKSYIGHVLTISIAIVSVIIPLLLKNDVVKIWNSITFRSQIWFFVVILSSILFYMTWMNLQRREYEANKRMVDIVNEYAYDLSLKDHFLKKIHENKESYLNNFQREIVASLNNIFSNLVNIFFILSLCIFFVWLLLWL